MAPLKYSYFNIDVYDISVQITVLSRVPCMAPRRGFPRYLLIHSNQKYQFLYRSLQIFHWSASPASTVQAAIRKGYLDLAHLAIRTWVGDGDASQLPCVSRHIDVLDYNDVADLYIPTRLRPLLSLLQTE